MILSTFLLSLYIQLFLLNCQISQYFRKPVGNFPKEIWTRSLVYSGLVYSGTQNYFSFCQGRKIRLFLTRFQHHSPVFVSHSQTLSFNQRSTKGTFSIMNQSSNQIKTSFVFVYFLPEDHMCGRVCVKVFSSVDFC